ncbi:fatty acid desaturase family protein [Aurantibacillus circumpalustris]|uniref:fatty acid desaturase family protein n=1 Tax=Aurantibacillus circumpalustris TaxID=3036359 RepID=UPI00295B91C0|nr:acyl-CoA desaturase [Aurantibacillus circumpalustris]
MNPVRFTSKDANEKLFVNTLKKNVNDYFKTNHLSTKANSAMVIKSIILISLYLVPFVLILTIPMNSWLALLCTVVMGIGIAGVGMGVMHDAAHGAYSRKHWLNDLLAGSLYLLGSNVLNWKIQHNVLHHTYTNVNGLDEDIDEKGPIRLSENTPLKKIHRFQYIYAVFFYGLMTVVMLTNDFTRLRHYSKLGLLKTQGKNLQTEFIKMLFRKAIYLGLIFGLPLWLTPFNFWQVLLGFFVMHWIASIILSFVFQMAHVVEGASQEDSLHDIETDWHVHQLRTTSDFARNNRLLSWYVGGLNFQIEHHLFPGICHIHYKKIAPIVEATALKYNMPYNLKPSFRAALFSHTQRLKELGRA